MKPGYSSYIVEPDLGGLQWLKGKVPTPYGDIEISVNTKQIKITTVSGNGILRFKSISTPQSKNGIISSIGNNAYEMILDGGKEYIVNYSSFK